MQDVSITEALPDHDMYPVIALERHLWHRKQSADTYAPFEVLADGSVGVFLTVSRMQRLLAEAGSPKTGRDYAAEAINKILPRLGLLEDSGEVKKPMSQPNSRSTNTQTEGGRTAQPSIFSSYWWRKFRLPTIKVFRFGAYPSQVGYGQIPPRHRGSACLCLLLKSQGLISSRRTRKFGRGSVQEAFAMTGPP